MRRLVPIILFAILIFAGFRTIGMNASSGVASKLMLNSAEKSHTLCYDATVRTTASFGGRPVTSLSRIQHSAEGERIEYLSKPLSGMAVVTHDGAVRTYSPTLGHTTISRAAAVKDSREKTILILKNYNARVIGEDKVAGRRAYVIAITPKHKGNPSKQIWIDKDTSLVLASIDKSTSGDIRSQMRFVKLKYLPHIHEQTFDLPKTTNIEVDRPLSREDLSRRIGVQVTPPTYIPAGYKLDGYRLYLTGCKCEHESAVIRYTDGLNPISVFYRPSKMDCGDKCCEMKDMHSGSCKISDCSQAMLGSRVTGSKAVVVVADLPREEIERIANSIR